MVKIMLITIQCTSTEQIKELSSFTELKVLWKTLIICQFAFIKGILSRTCQSHMQGNNGQERDLS